jgi:glycosyltransferase involved in cell wall biosynthesis
MTNGKKQSVFLAYSVGDSAVSDFFSQLALCLSENHTVVVFSDKKNPFPFSSEPVHLLNWPSPRPTKLRDFLFLRRQIKKFRPQLMLSTFGANNMFLIGGYLSGVRHRIVTHRTISSHFKSSAFKLFRKKKVFKLATQIISNSGATKEDLIRTFGVAPEKVKVVYNAVSNPNIQETRDPNLILYAGRLSTNKGIDVLLKAFRIVAENDPSPKLKVLGGTPEQVGNYQNMAKGLGLGSRVTFEGSQPGSRVLTEFAKARFVVVPSLSEGFGFVVIEAFSVKTPVIGSNTGGIKEIIRNGKDGLLFPPGDHNALASAIKELYDDEAMVAVMGENAYRRFLNTFELDGVVEELCSYLSTQISN